jgi:hypothetical protein
MTGLADRQLGWVSLFDRSAGVWQARLQAICGLTVKTLQEDDAVELDLAGLAAELELDRWV